MNNIVYKECLQLKINYNEDLPHYNPHGFDTSGLKY